MQTRILAWVWIVGGCTSTSFDLSGPLGDECDGAACRPLVDRDVLDEGPPVDRGPDPVDTGTPDQAMDAAPASDAAPVDAVVDAQVDAADARPDAEIPCEAGTSRPCGPETGACEPGTETCTPDGTWGPCLGATEPAPEACDDVDNDCDGQTDEAVTLPCGTDEGACEAGLRRCMAGGVLGACEGGVGPQPEACNGADDDCDGASDEEVLEGCEPAAGVCAAGTRACVAGAFGECVQPGGPIDELCDGADNDCDGAADEGLVRPCGPDEGACEAGIERCLGNTWSLCEGGVGPADEQCNNLDDDCDGQTDEALVRPCGSNVAPCQEGVEVCAAGIWGACEGGVQPSDEVCDAADNDCDGTADEALEAVACGGNLGRCTPGIRRCVGGVPGPCEGGIEAVPEDCNLEDDDCDGATDEALDRVCGSNVGICLQGIEQCIEGGYGPCLGGVEPLFEICNGLDDDCDGQVDVAADGATAECFVAHAESACVGGACNLVACSPGWQDVNGDPSDGCERGAALAQQLQLLDPVLAGTPVRVRAGAGVTATVFLRGADAASARLTLLIGEAAREIGDVNVAYEDVDLATTDPGFIVVGVGERGLMRARVVTWTRRAGDGTLLFSGSEPASEARQVAVAAAPAADRFLLVWVDGAGSLFIMVRGLSGRGDPVVGPFRLAAGSTPDVRPAVVALPDGFAIFAPLADMGSQLGGWFLDFDGAPLANPTVNLENPATDLGVTVAGGLGRVAIRQVGTVWIQDFTPSAERAGFREGRAVGGRLAARNPGLVRGQGGWILAWLEEATSQPMACLLDDAGTLLGEPFPLLPGVRDAVDILHIHTSPNAAFGRIGVTTGARGRVGSFEFN